MKRRTFVKSAGAAPAGLFFWKKSREGPIQVETESGEVEGSRLESGVREWLGIPYAEQPVGDLRWRPPRTPAPEFDGVLDATEYGPECIQSSVFGERGQEACLNLNVWAPSDATKWNRKPVMVWIHGGAYESGSNRYDSRLIAEEGDVVVVAVNYRLNVLGFFAHPALTAENEGNVNQGYQDIRAALEWVQRNVHAFGGDPREVTVFGESAGGHAVQTLVTDPDAEGLFDRAISQSGPGAAPMWTLEDREELGVRVAERLGCTGSNALECLREKSASELLAAYSQEGGGFLTGGGTGSAAEPPMPITLDGTVIEEHPLKRYREGEFHDVPLTLGGNNDEAQLFIALGFQPSTTQEYEFAVRARYPDHADRVLELYPPEDFESPVDAIEKVSTDQSFLCADAAVAEWMTENGGEAYRYIFDDVPTTPAPFLIFQDTEVGAYHSAELLYVFGTQIGQMGVSIGSLGPDDQKLARTMRAYWTGFAEYGRPTTFSFDDLLSWFSGSNDTYREFWPRYGGGDWRVRFEQDGVTRERGTRQECRFWCDYYEDVLPL